MPTGIIDCPYPSKLKTSYEMIGQLGLDTSNGSNSKKSPENVFSNSCCSETVEDPRPQVTYMVLVGEV